MLTHVSVLLSESVKALDLQPNNIVVDGTLGLGGHARHFLQAIGEKGHLYGFDWDERNLELAAANLQDFKNKTFIHSSFADLQAKLNQQGISEVNGIFLDLGISNAHLEDADRGLSFRFDGPLDMRMDTSLTRTATDIVNEATEQELADIFYHYGELKSSYKLAEAILQQRQKSTIATTFAFAQLVRSVFGEHTKVLPQVFQALRIAVNGELDAIKSVLPQARDVLAVGGSLAIISFHSLEDRLVKNFFRETFQADRKAWQRTKKPIVPTAEEIANNPKSRSAKLRVLQRLL